MRQPKNTISVAGTVGAVVIALTGPVWNRASAQETPPAPPREPVKVERARIVPPAPPPTVESVPVEKGVAAPSPDRKPESVSPGAPASRIGEARPGHHAVHDVRLVKAGGGRVDGARQGEWIAFDMVGEDERYDVYVMLMEGGTERCLTCENWEFRKTHALNPAWHPSGEYLAIQVQSNPKRRGLDAVGLATPHRALGCELWIITRDGKNAWQFTRLAENGGALLDPHFSHEAGYLVWSERLTSREAPWGEWGLQVAEFKTSRGFPRLGKTRTYRSGIGQGLAVAHDFTPDDTGLFVSAIPDRGLDEPDILRVDLETERVDRLTSSPDQSDELVSGVPYSDYYVWVTDRGLDDPRQVKDRRGPLPRRTEVWLRSASGMSQERLTYFNHPRSDHYLGAAMIGDLSWTADGEGLLLHVLSVPEGSLEAKEDIFLVKLGKEYQRR